jgi:hypothetical protein
MSPRLLVFPRRSRFILTARLEADAAWKGTGGALAPPRACVSMKDSVVIFMLLMSVAIFFTSMKPTPYRPLVLMLNDADKQLAIAEAQRIKAYLDEQFGFLETEKVIDDMFSDSSDGLTALAGRRIRQWRTFCGAFCVAAPRPLRHGHSTELAVEPGRARRPAPHLRPRGGAASHATVHAGHLRCARFPAPHPRPFP